MKLYLTTGKKQLEVLLLQPRKLHSIVVGVFVIFFCLVGQGFCLFVRLVGWLVLVWFGFYFFFSFFKPNYYQIIPSKAPGKCISFHLRGALSHFVSLLRRSLLCQVCPHTCTCCEDSLESD